MDGDTKQVKGSADIWLQAAYELLLDSGVDAVKVMPLAKRLGLSRTSFYWHFKDREALLDAVVNCWENKNTGNLIARVEAYAESISEAMLNLFDCWLDCELFDARFDQAIRNWAQNDGAVQLRIDAADTRRKAAIKAMFLRFGFSDQQAEVRAMTILYTQVGYIAMGVNEPLKPRIKRMPDYVEVYTGQKPTKNEFARFCARHRVSLND